MFLRAQNTIEDMKKFFTIILLLMSLASYSEMFCKSAVPDSNSYVAYVKPEDFGGSVPKIVINLGKTVHRTSVKKEDFTVDVVLTGSSRKIDVIKSQRAIKEVFISDGEGSPVEDYISRYVTILMEVHPSDPYSVINHGESIIGFDSFYWYRIKNEALNVRIENRVAVVCPEISCWETGGIDDQVTEDETVSLKWAKYIPENSKDTKIPLIVFFHGIGESGKDINKPLLKIKISSLSQPQIQSHFPEGAAVLVPQCPTGWLELTETDSFGNRLWAPVDINGTVNRKAYKISKAIAKVISVPEEQYTPTVVTPVSWYTLTVKKLIDQMIEENPQIDPSRIYVGGCSAGGFMTVNMMIQYHDFFAAAFPICEAFPTVRINPDDIRKLAEKSLWFIVSLDDETINPKKHTLSLVEKLTEADPLNLHKSYYDSVKDSTGLYSDSKTNLPWSYDGHEVWSYVFNDKVFEGELNLFDWLSAQRNSN